MKSEQPTDAASSGRIADIGVLLTLAVLTGLYCYDAVSASTHVYNLIMVLPLTALVFVLCAAQFVSNLRNPAVVATAEDGAKGVLPGMSLFGAYVLSLPWLGFDVGTALFVGGFLWLQGERRWPWLFGYSIAFGFALSIFFSKMLPYPMPLLVTDTLTGMQ